MVDLTFTDDGKTVFADATTKNVGKRIAIIYDGKIYSNPVVNEPITQGQCQISGMTSYEEAGDAGFYYPYRFPFPGAGRTSFQRW